MQLEFHNSELVEICVKTNYLSNLWESFGN